MVGSETESGKIVPNREFPRSAKSTLQNLIRTAVNRNVFSTLQINTKVTKQLARRQNQAKITKKINISIKRPSITDTYVRPLTFFKSTTLALGG
jgi:hypothetical protein